MKRVPDVGKLAWRKLAWRRAMVRALGFFAILTGAVMTALSLQAMGTAASATPTSLGTTPAYFQSIFGLGDYSAGDASISGDTVIAGHFVVDGNLRVDAGATLSVGSLGLQTPPAVVQVTGDAEGPGALCLAGFAGSSYGFYGGTSNVSLPCSTHFYQATGARSFSPLVFEAVNSDLSTISTDWASLATAANGTEVLSGSTLELTGTASTVDVFSVPMSDFEAAAAVNIDVPAGTQQVLVDVNGNPASSTPMPLAQIQYVSSSPSNMADNTWFNFTSTAAIYFAQPTFDANLLAIDAPLYFGGTQLQGYTYAASLNGTFNSAVPPQDTLQGPSPGPCQCETTSSTTSTTVPPTSTTVPPPPVIHKGSLPQKSPTTTATTTTTITTVATTAPIMTTPVTSARTTPVPPTTGKGSQPQKKVTTTTATTHPLPTTSTTVAGRHLAYTGSNSGRMAMLGLGLMFLGGAMVSFSARRRRRYA